MPKLLALLRSPSIRSSALLALTGLGFAGSNLIFASLMEPTDYGLLTLLVSILNVAAPFAPLGLDGLVIRHRLPPSRALLRAGVAAAAVVALGVALIGGLLYPLGPVVVALAVGAGIGGVGMLAASVVQSRHEFTLALLIAQSSNLFLISAALLGLALGLTGFAYVLAIVILGSLWVATASWRRLLRDGEAPAGALEISWREALSYAGVNAAGQLMQQFERLAIPKVLSLEDLAVFGVVAAVVLAPFRTVQMAVSFTIAPRLRAAGSAAERRAIVAREVLMLLAIAAVAGAILYAVSPWILELLYDGKYAVSRSLLVATLAVGVLRLYSGLTRGITTALCTTRELAQLNVLLGLTLGATAISAAFGATWGLSGVVYGVGFGWLARIAVSAALAARHLRG